MTANASKKPPPAPPLTANKLYWYDQEGNAIYETDAAGYELYRYFRFGGLLVTREEANDWVDHYGLDALGNVRWLYGTNGAWDIIDYYPFGGERVVQSNSTNTRLFTGKERDSESGLDNFGARYDSSSLGRFMSPDPANAGAESEAPQSWNAYSYAANNPINGIDQSGMDCIYVQGDSSWEIVRGDCKSESDNGIFVDGRIIGKTVVVTQDSEGNADTVSFLYNPTGTKELLFHGESDPAISPAPSFLGGFSQFFVDTLKGMDPFHDPTSVYERNAQSLTFIFGSVLGPEEEAGVAGALTRWGWKGALKWRNAIRTLSKPGTHLALEGVIPKVEEATAMIKEAGGTINRVQEGHAAEGVSPHTYPHINYTTASGQKATVRVDSIR